MATLLIAAFGVVAVGVSAQAAAAPATFGASAALKSDACSGISQIDASQGCGSNSNGTVNTLISTGINILSVIVGFAAIIMLIINAFRMVTSQGDSSAVASARSGIIYALVGLAVAALAQLLVHFVLSKV